MPRTKRLLTSICVSALIATVSAPASADLFASGDSNILGQEGPLPLPNLNFFRNIVGGQTVLIQGDWDFDTNAINLANFYNGAGFSASVLASSARITSSALAGVDLFIGYFPEDDYTAEEISAVRSFLGAGHNVLIAGDNAFYMFPFNFRVNALLAGVGSSMRLVEGPLVDGYFAAQLQGPSSYLAGTSGFRYGAASTVTGGLPLFGTAGDNLPFLAVEAIPEPSTYALMAMGLAVVGWAARSTKRSAA